MIHADPAFSHLFRLNLKIHKITQSSSLPPSSIFPNSPFYLITITIVPRLLTDLTHPEILRPTTNSPVTANLTPPTVRPRRRPLPLLPSGKPFLPSPPPYILEPPCEMMSAMWSAIPPNINNDPDFSPSTLTTTLSRPRGRAMGRIIHKIVKRVCAVFRRKGKDRQGFKSLNLPYIFTSVILTATLPSDLRRRAQDDFGRPIAITSKDDKARNSELRIYDFSPSLFRRTTKMHSELTNQLPQVIPLLVCVAQIHAIRRGHYVVIPLFYYANHEIAFSGNDGHLIPPILLRFEFFLTTDNFDISFLPMPLSSHHYVQIGQLNFCFKFFSYNYYLGLSIFDSLLDILVKFSNTCLASQDPYMEHTGLSPTKIDSDFCWSFFSENFKSKFEFIKLLSTLGENFEIQTQSAQLIENLKWRFKQRNLSNSKPIYIKSPASQKCKNNLIKFPAPRVSTFCTSNQVRPEGTFQTWKPLHIHKHLQFELPTLWEEFPKRLSLKRICLEPEEEEFYFTDNDTPYELQSDDEIIIYPTINHDTSYMVFTAYKRVDKKIHPISMQLPIDCEVTRNIPENPLLTLSPLTNRPPNFIPTSKITLERMNELNVNANGFLWPEEEKLFQHIMRLNEHAIAFEDMERGTLKDSYFSPYIIPTIPHSPWEYKNIPIPPGLLPKVLEVLNLKIAAGVYEQSQSSYRSRWFVVLKKNGKLRIVHDLQPLNKITIRDAGMVPIIDDFVEGFAGHQCYSVFDLFWGFDARKIHPKSRGLTAFMTPLGLLQITSLPTGFTNSPAEFQKCMVMVLKDEIPHTANIFIDDLPIKGPKTQYPDAQGNPEILKDNPGIRRFIWEHAQDVHRVLHRLHCAGVTISSKKAQICLPEVLIVGQCCNAKGREPDTEKTSKILKWPPLTTPKEVRRFLGLCGTVRIWIPNYSKIVRPLTQLYHKDKDFIWEKEQQDAFDEIKNLITKAPALHPIDYTSDNPVILSVDSSRDAAGMILSQMDNKGRKRPARYGSVPMSERESRYSQPKLELFGLYRALRHWRLYIIGVKNLQVEVDAKFIKGMLNDPDLQPNAAINRWIQGILMFDFALVHVPADRHKGPDALSRRTLAEGELVESDDDSWLDNIALLTYFPRLQKDPFTIFPSSTNKYSLSTLPSCFAAARSTQEILITEIRNFLESLETPVFNTVQKKRRFLAKATEFFIKEKRLFKRNGDRPPLLVIFTPEQKLSILKQAHEGTGHRGIQAVFELIRHKFFWPYFRADIHHHVKSCHDCQIRSLKRTEIPLTISAPTTLFTKVYIDIMHMPESTENFKYIVAARDDLSGTCEARALQHASSKELAKFFWEELYCRYGAPQRVITDNGPEVKKAFDALLKRLGIPQIRITPYNHHANGVVERGHFILREAIVKSCKGDFRQWPSKLAEAIFADRITISRVTGFSPYQLLHATEPLLPMDLIEATFLVENLRSGISTSELLVIRMRQLHKHPQDIERAAKILKKARFASKAQFEQRFVKRLSRDEYKSGELVLVRNTAIEVSHNRKHQPRYLGPYEIDKKASEKSYALKDLDGTPFRQRTGTFRLLPYISRRHQFMQININKDSSDSGTNSEESKLDSSDSD